MNDLLNTAITSAGGLDRFMSFNEVHLNHSFGGLGLKSRLLFRRYQDLEIHVSIHEQRVLWLGYPSRHRGLYRDGAVRIEREDGTLVKERKDAKRHFRNWRQQFWWDDLDVLYFMSYAMWNYVLAPFLFVREGFQTLELEPRAQTKGPPWSRRSSERPLRRLLVVHPPDIHTHSQVQIFNFDSRGLLHHLEYTAEIVGPWAKSIHYCRNYQDFSGFQWSTSRRVFLANDVFLRRVRTLLNLGTLQWGEWKNIRMV